MRSFCFLFLASALSVSSSGKLVAPKPELQYSSHVNTQRAVIGSVADITSKYENGTLVTVVHILESRTDLFPREPRPFAGAFVREPSQQPLPCRTYQHYSRLQSGKSKQTEWLP